MEIEEQKRMAREREEWIIAAKEREDLKRLEGNERLDWEYEKRKYLEDITTGSPRVRIELYYEIVLEIQWIYF